MQKSISEKFLSLDKKKARGLLCRSLGTSLAGTWNMGSISNQDGGCYDSACVFPLNNCFLQEEIADEISAAARIFCKLAARLRR